MAPHSKGGERPGLTGQAAAALIRVLESDELYTRQRERKLSVHDVRLINEYVAKLPTAEWEVFKAHCIQNELDPLKEMRELILATYMRNFAMHLRRMRYEEVQD